jgi:hypothetical protein
MRNIFWIALYILLSSPSTFSYVEKYDKTSKEDQKTLKQVKLQKGSLVVMEQFLTKKHKYNNSDSYELRLICDKTKPKKTANCKVIEYKILAKQTR